MIPAELEELLEDAMHQRVEEKSRRKLERPKWKIGGRK